MSSEQHHNTGHGGAEPTHSDVSFESSDINTRSILLSLLYLGIAVAIAFVITVFVYRGTNKFAADSETQMAPSHRGVAATMPPEPMLQGVPGHENDPQQDLRNKIQADTAGNDEIQLLTDEPGFARIPVEDAMKILVSKGLSGTPAASPAAAEKKN